MTSGASTADVAPQPDETVSQSDNTASAPGDMEVDSSNGELAMVTAEPGTLIKLNEAEYFLTSRRHLPSVHTYPFNEQANLSGNLKLFLKSTREEGSEALALQSALTEELDKLKRLLLTFPHKLWRIGEYHRRNCARLDMTQLNKLKRRLKNKIRWFPRHRDAIIRELNYIVGVENRNAVKQRLEVKITSHESECAALERQIQACKESIGLWALYNELFLQKSDLREREKTAKAQLEKCEADSKVLEHNIPILKRAVEKLAGDAEL